MAIPYEQLDHRTKDTSNHEKEVKGGTGARDVERVAGSDPVLVSPSCCNKVP